MRLFLSSHPPFPLTPLLLRFLYSPEELLLEEVEKGTDVLEVVARAAKRMVRIPCKVRFFPPSLQLG